MEEKQFYIDFYYPLLYNKYDIQRRKIMDEYLVFLDETKPVKNQSPFFCLAGLIISKEEYVKHAIPQINKLKEEFFKTSSIIFHFTDMKKNRNKFSDLTDTETRDNFWDSYRNILKALNFTTIGIYFNEETMKNIYAESSYKNYDIAFISLLDNIMHFLYHNSALGQICIESRTLKENSYLLNSYYDYLNRDSLYYPINLIQKHLSALGFIYKEDNCIGLQIADMIPSLMIRQKLNKIDNFKIKTILYNKLYCKGKDLEKIVGFKQIL